MLIQAERPHSLFESYTIIGEFESSTLEKSIGFKMEPHTIKFNMVSEPIKPKRVFGPR